MSSQLKSLNSQEKLKYLNSLRVHDLRDIASELNIKGRSKMRKQEFIENIIRKISEVEKPKYCEINLLKCNGLSISGNVLVKCENISDKEYCPDHSHRYRLEKPDDCPICMDTISKETETPLTCGHWVHKECLIPTNNYICPLCRQDIKEHEIEYIFGKNHQRQSDQVIYIPLNGNINLNNLESLLGGEGVQFQVEDVEMEYFDESEFEYRNFENIINHNEDIYQDEDINNRIIDDFSEYINPFDEREFDHISYIIGEIERNPRDTLYMLSTVYSIVPNELRDNLEQYLETLIYHFGEVNNFHIDDIMNSEIRIRLASNEQYRNLISISYNLRSSSNFIAHAQVFRVENIIFQLISEIHNIITFNF